MKTIDKDEARKQLSRLEKEVSKLREIIDQPEYSVKDIKSLDDACDILGENKRYFMDASTSKRLKTIIKAANFIANGGEVWIPDFTNRNKYKFIPYFERKASGWVAYFVSYCYSSSGYPLGFYFKNREDAEYISKQFIDLYNTWLEE